MGRGRSLSTWSASALIIIGCIEDLLGLGGCLNTPTTSDLDQMDTRFVPGTRAEPAAGRWVTDDSWRRHRGRRAAAGGWRSRACPGDHARESTLCPSPDAS